MTGRLSRQTVASPGGWSQEPGEGEQAVPSLPQRMRLDQGHGLATPPEHEGLELLWDSTVYDLIYMAYDIFSINDTAPPAPPHAVSNPRTRPQARLYLNGGEAFFLPSVAQITCCWPEETVRP